MELVEVSYFTALGAIAALLVCYRLFHAISLWIASPLRCLGSVSLYHLFLRYIAYPRLRWRLLAVEASSPLQIVMLILYIVATAIGPGR